MKGVSITMPTDVLLNGVWSWGSGGDAQGGEKKNPLVEALHTRNMVGVGDTLCSILIDFGLEGRNLWMARTI